MNNDFNTSKGSSRKRNWKKIIIVIVLTITLICLACYGALVIQMEGGPRNVILNMTPPPNINSTSFIEKREKSKQEIEEEFRQIEKMFTPSSTKDSTYDICAKGQNNWKIHSGFAYKCSYHITRFYGFNGDFRQKILKLEQDLFSLGWTNHGSVNTSYLSNIINEHYNEYYGKPRRYSRENPPAIYTVSDLPEKDYAYKKSKNGTSIGFEFAEKSSKDTPHFEHFTKNNSSGNPYYEKMYYEMKDLIDAGLAFNDISVNNKYIIAITIRKDAYFEN